MQRHSAHLESIAVVARRLAELKTEVVFTGGAIVGLLLTDSAALDVRPTDDIDVIVGIARYADYASLQEELRMLGLKHDIDGPSCRFVLDGLKVDVMPTEGKVLGFTNRWYDFAVSSAIDHRMADGTCIRLISAPAFVATKLEAFHDRGKGDFSLSHDMEDIIAVVDGRPELFDEISTTHGDVRQYITDCFSKLVIDPAFFDAIGMNLLPDDGSQARARIVFNRVLAISQLTKPK